ncbi:unnamed protein product, partial [Prorocentrum cordatum]
FWLQPCPWFLPRRLIAPCLWHLSENVSNSTGWQRSRQISPMEATGRAREGRNTVKGSTTDRKMRRQHARISADNLIRRLYTEIATLKWKIDSYDAWYWSWAKAKHEPNAISYNDEESCTVAVAEAKHEPNAISYNGDDPAKSCTAVVGDAKHEPNVISCDDVKSCTVATAEAKHEPNAISYRDESGRSAATTKPNVDSCRPENGAQVKMEPDDFYPSYCSGISACERGGMIEPFTSHTSRSTPSLGPGCSSYGYSAAIGPRRMQQVKLEPNIASYRDAISQELREISGTPGAPFLPGGSAVIDWGAIKNTDQDCKQM